MSPQRDQLLPTLSALGTVGGTPVRPGQYYVSSWDGAIAANLNIPIFNGFLYSAQAKEAQLRAQATAEQTRQLKNVIVRDVQTAWLDANNAFTRLGVTAQLLNQANDSLGLAQTRRLRLGGNRPSPTPPRRDGDSADALEDVEVEAAEPDDGDQGDDGVGDGQQLRHVDAVPLALS